jgi:hypothetical protein
MVLVINDIVTRWGSCFRFHVSYHCLPGEAEMRTHSHKTWIWKSRLCCEQRPVVLFRRCSTPARCSHLNGGGCPLGHVLLTVTVSLSGMTLKLYEPHNSGPLAMKTGVRVWERQLCDAHSCTSHSVASGGSGTECPQGRLSASSLPCHVVLTVLGMSRALEGLDLGAVLGMWWPHRFLTACRRSWSLRWLCHSSNLAEPSARHHGVSWMLPGNEKFFQCNLKLHFSLWHRALSYKLGASLFKCWVEDSRVERSTVFHCWARMGRVCLKLWVWE